MSNIFKTAIQATLGFFVACGIVYVAVMALIALIAIAFSFIGG